MRSAKFTSRGAGTIACIAVLQLPGPALAARPMITDDARIVDAQACQLETWVRRNEDSSEFWALPACNFTGRMELGLGGALTRESGETHTTDVQFQAKTLFKALEANGWGVGLAVGYLKRVREECCGGGARNIYGYVPLSVSFADDRLVLHANVGAQRPEEARRHRGTWAVGAELQLATKLHFIPEIFSQEPGRPHFQAGFRYWVIPERMQIDATYGDRLGGHNGVAERWFSVGMRLVTSPFLPK